MNKSAKICTTILFLAVLLSICLIQTPAFAQTEKGVTLLNYWDFEKAEDVFREVLKNNPADSEAGYYLGMSLLMQKRYQESIEVIKKIKELAEHFEEAYHMLNCDYEKGASEQLEKVLWLFEK